MIWITDRPWGKFATFAMNEKCTVKVITVDPGQKLSVQKHANRDERWICLDEGLIATIEQKQISLSMVGEIFIPRGSIHTVENRGIEPARFLEISYGEFDENDIVRLSDKYG